MDLFLNIFSIVSGGCSIIGLIVTLITFSKVTKINSTINNLSVDKSNNSAQSNKGNGNINYRGGN